MEHLLEIIVLGQSCLLLWFFLQLQKITKNLDIVIVAHNRMATTFYDVMMTLMEEDTDDKSNLH